MAEKAMSKNARKVLSVLARSKAPLSLLTIAEKTGLGPTASRKAVESINGFYLEIGEPTDSGVVRWSANDWGRRLVVNIDAAVREAVLPNK